MDYYKYKGILYKIVDDPNPDKDHKYVLCFFDKDDDKWFKYISGSTVECCIAVAEEMIDNFISNKKGKSMKKLIVYKGVTFKITVNPYPTKASKYIVYIYNLNDNVWDKFIYGRTIKRCVDTTKEIIDDWE